MKILLPFLFAAWMAVMVHLYFALIPGLAGPLAAVYFISALLALSYYDYHRHYRMHR